MGVTGVAPADEMARTLVESTDTIFAENVISDFDFASLDCAPELRQRLRAAVEAANGMAPMSWSPAKCEMVFGGRTADELSETAAAIERECDLQAQRIDPPSKLERVPVDQPVGQVEEAEIVGESVRPLSDQAQQVLNGLLHLEADLSAAVDEAEPGSEDHASRLGELETLEARLRREFAGHWPVDTPGASE